MNDILKGINHDKIYSVFEAALSLPYSTRNDLSEITGLSYTTVDKITNGLIEEGILRQTKGTDYNGSRRSRIVRLKSKLWFAVYVMNRNTCDLRVYDLRLRCILPSVGYLGKQETYDYFISDYIKVSRNRINIDLRLTNAGGIAVLVPGSYNEKEDIITNSGIPGISDVRLKDHFSTYDFGVEPMITSLFSAFGEKLRSNISENECIMALNLCIGYVYNTYIQGSSVCAPLYINDLGSVSVSDGRRLTEIIKSTPYPDKFFEALSEVVFKAMYTVPVTSICVSGDLYNEQIDAVAKVLYNYLKRHCDASLLECPEVTHRDISRESSDYYAYLLRRKWFFENILS